MLSVLSLPLLFISMYFWEHPRIEVSTLSTVLFSIILSLLLFHISSPDWGPLDLTKGIMGALVMFFTIGAIIISMIGMSRSGPSVPVLAVLFSSVGLMIGFPVPLILRYLNEGKDSPEPPLEPTRPA